MDEVIKTLTIIGAILGSIAFFRDLILSPIVTHNKNKWAALKDDISDNDFENICYSIEYSRCIDGYSMVALEKLIHDIEQDSEKIDFKSLFSNKYQTRFTNLNDTYRKLRDLIQVPYWRPVKFDENNIGYEIDKAFFYENASTEEDYRNADKKFREHLDTAIDLAESMRSEFKKIRIMSNREIHEFFLPWNWKLAD